MIENDVGEVGGVQVAVSTRRGKVVGWRGVAFGAIACADGAVVEGGILPVGGGVAGGALCPIFAIVGIIGRMAGNTGYGRPPIHPLLMAGGTITQGMAARQGEKAMPHHRPRLWGKDDRLSGKLAFWCIGGAE